jgi:hypothetical protein
MMKFLRPTVVVLLRRRQSAPAMVARDRTPNGVSV